MALINSILPECLLAGLILMGLVRTFYSKKGLVTERTSHACTAGLLLNGIFTSGQIEEAKHERSGAA